jgi:hypothetical protein
MWTSVSPYAQDDDAARDGTRWIADAAALMARRPDLGLLGRGLHSFTFQLNLSRFGHICPRSPV